MARKRDLPGQTELVDREAAQLAERFAPRDCPPDEATDGGDELSFVVWGSAAAYLEDTRPIKVCAAFRYLQEALDYIAYCQDQGADVWFQSPCGVQQYRPTDRRAVVSGCECKCHRRGL